MTQRINKNLKRFAGIIVAGFVLIYAISSFHACRFSHFTNTHLEKTSDPQKLSALKKIKTLLMGIDNPWPGNPLMLTRNYETIRLKKVSCPTLLLYGEKAERVSRQEIDEIYSNLNCNKELKTFPDAGHQNYLVKYKQEWSKDIEDFLLKF